LYLLGMRFYRVTIEILAAVLFIAFPDIHWPISFGLPAVTELILVALVVSPDHRESHFVRQDGAITALSAILLAMSSGFARPCFYLSCGLNLMSRIFWLVSAAALGFLVLDELLMFHENLHIWLAGMGLATTSVFRDWNDGIALATMSGKFEIDCISIEDFKVSAVRVNTDGSVFCTAFTPI
jgi:hypothetical protein